jgi:hypothetical protein
MAVGCLSAILMNCLMISRTLYLPQISVHLCTFWHSLFMYLSSVPNFPVKVMYLPFYFSTWGSRTLTRGCAKRRSLSYLILHFCLLVLYQGIKWQPRGYILTSDLHLLHKGYLLCLMRLPSLVWCSCVGSVDKMITSAHDGLPERPCILILPLSDTPPQGLNGVWWCD